MKVIIHFSEAPDPIRFPIIRNYLKFYSNGGDVSEGDYNASKKRITFSTENNVTEHGIRVLKRYIKVDRVLTSF